MKKTLCLILAALLLASSMTACGKTEPAETKAETIAPVETKAPETDAPETEAPAAYAYDTALVTENGVAKAHIVVAESAEQYVTYAAQELVYHIKKVTGADVPVTSTVQSDSLPIIIATPNSLPELETLFPDDLAWLREIGEEGTNVRYGDDGFAIRSHEGKIYIFGAVEKGALNGTYDFIEENMGVLWTRADESIGLIYDEMPTVTVLKTDYREKSPFQIRAWLHGPNEKTEIMYCRNKLNHTMFGPYETTEICYTHIGQNTCISGHNIKWWVEASPIYDTNITEYWSTDLQGNHVTYPWDSQQVNYWSDVTVDTVAASVIDFLDKNKENIKVKYIGISNEDVIRPHVYPEMTEPYEYAPGQFVTPSDSNYLSTVFFSFLNKVARKVAEKHPDVILHAYAYDFTEIPPACELDDNVGITFCSINEDLSRPIDDPTVDLPYITWKNLEGWIGKTKKIMFYSYYGCFIPQTFYERPIWRRMQETFQFYAANGLLGNSSEGGADAPFNNMWILDGGIKYGEGLNGSDEWAMNALTYWLYAKLSWNPNEDVDALIDDFCQKSYGEAAPHMREYYRLIEAGWTEGKANLDMEFNSHLKWFTRPITYWDCFIDIEIEGASLVESIQATLAKAWEAAGEEDRARIEHIKNCWDNAESWFVG